MTIKTTTATASSPIITILIFHAILPLRGSLRPPSWAVLSVSKSCEKIKWPKGHVSLYPIRLHLPRPLGSDESMHICSRQCIYDPTSMYPFSTYQASDWLIKDWSAMERVINFSWEGKMDVQLFPKQLGHAKNKRLHSGRKTIPSHVYISSSSLKFVAFGYYFPQKNLRTCNLFKRQ